MTRIGTKQTPEHVAARFAGRGIKPKMQPKLEAIAYSLAGPEKGAPVPVIGCSLCGALALNWGAHFSWHLEVAAHFGQTVPE